MVLALVLNSILPEGNGGCAEYIYPDIRGTGFSGNNI